MTEFRITLPDWAGEFVGEQMSSGLFSSPDEVMVHLIDSARTRQASDRLAELILAGENSGEGTRFTNAWWERRISDLKAEAERKR